MKVDQGEDVAVAQVSAVQSGSALAANLAHNVVLVFCQQLEREGAPDAEKLQIALDLLQQPPLLSAQITAQAYNLVREVRKSCAPSCEELAKFAALATREVLVLHICCTSGSMSDIGFETALEHAFERELGPEFRSQLHFARSAICRLGRNRTVFERAAPKIFSSTLSSEELQALFTAYAECTTPVTTRRQQEITQAMEQQAMEQQQQAMEQQQATEQQQRRPTATKKKPTKGRP